MILLNSFYTVTELDKDSGQLSAVITIDPLHEIFRGHFPGQPVVPGVCMVQIVKELMEELAGKKLLLARAQQVKFLQLLVPVRDEPVQVHIAWTESETGYAVSAGFKHNNEAVCKLAGELVPYPHSAAQPQA